jgi:porphobilinogen synthase
MVAETHLNIVQLVWPVFMCEGQGIEIPIKTLPGCFRYSPDLLIKNIAPLYELGLRSVALFPAIEDSLKNSHATECLNSKGLVPKVVRQLKKQFPDLLVITDIALDPFSSDGHDGIVKDGKILNDETVEILAKMALVHAEAGADFVAPSDMMDGRIGAIRDTLDEAKFIDTGIISYSAKYASAFYGPFRDALSSAPKFGDKKTYQMDYRNSKESLLEVTLDIDEGADIVMVKPALSYLDIIYQVKQISAVPVAAYNVSGEYAMIKAAAQMGMIDEKKIVFETLYSMRRAGADLIFTYFVPQMAEWLNK